METDRSKIKAHMEEARLEDELRERRRKRSSKQFTSHSVSFWNFCPSFVSACRRIWISIHAEWHQKLTVYGVNFMVKGLVPIC